MKVHVRKWGHSLGLRIPKPLAEDAGVCEGTTLQLSLSRGRLVASPVRARKIRLKDLLANVHKSNLHAEVEAGAPVGREIW